MPKSRRLLDLIRVMSRQKDKKTKIQKKDNKTKIQKKDRKTKDKKTK